MGISAHILSSRKIGKFVVIILGFKYNFGIIADDSSPMIKEKYPFDLIYVIYITICIIFRFYIIYFIVFFLHVLCN